MFKTKKYRSKKEKIYENLKQEILLGTLKPGESIIYSEVEKKFNISRNPIREAMQQLEIEGLVTIKPYVGTMVSKLSKTDIEAIYEVRMLLESKAIKQSIKKIDKKDLMYLNENIDQSLKAIEEKDYLLIARLNKKFHMNMYKKCNNAYLIKIIEELWSTIFRYSLTLYSSYEVDSFIEEHKRIVHYLTEKDYNKTEKLLINHQKEAMLKIIDSIDKE